MKKILFLSVFILLGACTQKEYHIVREEVRSPQTGTIQQPIGLPEYMLQQPTDMTYASAPVQEYTQASFDVSNQAYTNTEVMLPSYAGNTAYQPATPMMAQPTYGVQTTFTPTFQRDSVTADAFSYTAPVPQNASPESFSSSSNSVISEEVPAYNVLPTSDPLMSVVLQHPENRDLVKCNASDAGCLQQYEGQGYIRLRNAPRFAGFKELPSESDYPQGSQWRDSNNIPRW